jgi:hypothetical protein
VRGGFRHVGAIHWLVAKTWDSHDPPEVQRGIATGKWRATASPS